MSKTISKKQQAAESVDLDNQITEEQETAENKESFYNRYATKKSFASGLMDGALLATNAAQLKLLLSKGFYDTNDPKWYVSIVLVSASLASQVLILGLLGVLAQKDLADRAKKTMINRMNNFVLLLTGIVFCLNIITNVFIQLDADKLQLATTPVAPAVPGDFMLEFSTPPNPFDLVKPELPAGQ